MMSRQGNPRPDAHKLATSLNPPPLTYPHAPASGAATPAGESVRPIRPGTITELVARIVPGMCVAWGEVTSSTRHPDGCWHAHCGSCDYAYPVLCFTAATFERDERGLIFGLTYTDLPLVGFKCEECGAWNAVPAMLGGEGLLPRFPDPSQPTQPEDLLAFSRPPARFSSSSAHFVVERDGTIQHDAAQPPAPRPRPPGSGSGTT